MKREFLSTENEPAHGQHSGEHPAPDPKEALIDEKIKKRGGTLSGSQAEMDEVRDHVMNEPALTGAVSLPDQDHLRFAQWLQEKRRQETSFTVLPLTILAGLCGGLFALLTALAHGLSSGYLHAFFAFLIVPMVEELGKQSGMIYLLERKPWKVIRTWQFILVALLASLLFATVENLLYLNVYASDLTDDGRQLLAQWRWPICTALHVSCSIIASLGLIRSWKKQLQDGKPVRLSFLNFPFIAAIALHGLYNLLVPLFFNPTVAND